MTGRYEIVERIATGGMAEIYKGRAIGADGFSKVVVIKRILPEYTQDEDFVAMFVHEAKLATMLNHPNIVQVFDLGKVGDEYFITMEHVDGPNLHAAAVRAFKLGYKPFPLKECLFTIVEACKGLDHAHRKTDANGRPLGIIHRDVSPPNILLSFEGSVKVADFGVAKARDQAVRTRTGVLKGKFGYMSPEQAGGRPIDHRSDVFSLGVVLWELLAGKRLFKGATPLQTVERVNRCEVPLVATYSPDIPPEVEGLVARALARDPAERFQSAGEMGEAITDYLFAAGLRVSARDLANFLRHVFMEEPVWQPTPMPPPLPRGRVQEQPAPTRTIVTDEIDLGDALPTELSAQEPSYSDGPRTGESAPKSAKYGGGTLLHLNPVTAAAPTQRAQPASNPTLPVRSEMIVQQMPAARAEVPTKLERAAKPPPSQVSAVRPPEKPSPLRWLGWTAGGLALAGAMAALIYFARQG